MVTPFCTKLYLLFQSKFFQTSLHPSQRYGVHTRPSSTSTVAATLTQPTGHMATPPNTSDKSDHTRGHGVTHNGKVHVASM